MIEPVPAQVLRDWIAYDGETGLLTWKVRSRAYFKSDADWKTFNARFAGKPALSSKGARGYLQGRLNYVTCLAHRAAWTVHHGEWPKNEIDHINGDRSDNRIVNLRDVSRLENARNLCSVKSATGVRGVTWDTRLRRYRSSIYVNGQRKYLGIFENIQDAVAARMEAQRALGFHSNHGTRPPAS